MKKILFATFMLVFMSGVGVHAGLAPSILPESSYYNGRHSFSFDLGSEGILNGRLEFAVYKDNEADTMMDWTEYDGEADYVYGYQVFLDQSSTRALTYAILTGVDPGSISDVQEDIGETESLNSGAIQSEGIEPTSSYFNDEVTQAIWQFDGGTFVQGEQSWFMFLYSDNDWIAGNFEVQLPNDEIPVPEVPEPATLALLACGTILSLRRRK